MNPPVLVLNTNMKREQGRKAQLGNIQAAKAVADVIRTSLGPRSMLKMLLDPMGGVSLTNDGNAILREIDVTHPAAKSMLELAKTQDEEVGDGTTSVIVLAGEALLVTEPALMRGLHPTVIIAAYRRALEDALAHLARIAVPVDLGKREALLSIVQSCIGTKFIARWSNMMAGMALDAVLTVAMDHEGRKEVDIKRYIKIEKIPGGEVEESTVLRGVLLNKDVTHTNMRRRIVNPRVLLLDCPLEYKKAESQTMVEATREEDFAALLKQEEEQIEKMVQDILKFKPDVVITEKGLSDLAQHFFVKANVTALRRLRKTDNNRIARACGATIVSRTDEIQESDIGTGCGLFEIKKIGDEYFTFISECKNPKACTIILRGASKDVLNEIERNLTDAMAVARNVVLDPRLVPGGGASEMAMAAQLTERSKSIDGVQQWPYRSAALALEVIPRTLMQNCGAPSVRLITELRAKHAAASLESATWGVDGIKGVLADMKTLGVWEPYAVKAQTIKTAVESACLLLRVDEVLSGLSKKEGAGGGAPAGPSMEEMADME